MLKQSRKSGFTLLELLIVVIIVSILAAVALPRFGKMTRRARATEAVTAVGAILSAETLYYQEYTAFGQKADLLVDLNETNFTYSVTTSANNTVVVAEGAASTPTEGITVTGTVTDVGDRTITTD